MRIGILTYHRALNYGAVLQAFALRTKLNRLQTHSEILDYRIKIIEDAYDYPGFSRQKDLKNKIKFLLQHKNEIRRRKLFEIFRNQYLLGVDSKIYTPETIQEAAEKYDKVFVGSDQVWNPNGNNFDTNFLLKFLKPEQKYSYAASFGISELEYKYWDTYRALLEEFQTISVREPQGRDIIEKLGLEARVDIDPVYLLSKEDWKQKFSLEQEGSEPYVLVYSFNVTPNQIRMAKACASKGYKIKYIGNPISNIMKMRCDYIRAAGPVDFLRLFYNASFVITNSFHGFSFSLLFNRPMAIELIGFHVNSRIENIIDLFGVQDRLLNEATTCDDLLKTVPNWEKINKIIDSQRQNTEIYLKECLQ